VPTQATHLPQLNTLPFIRFAVGIAYTIYEEFGVWQWVYHGNFLALLSREIRMGIQDTIK
jgi:hypothetical protein